MTGVNAMPFSMEDIDPETDVYQSVFSASDTTEASGALVSPVPPGSIWYVEAHYHGVAPIDSGDFNDGYLHITTDQFQPDIGANDGQIAMQRVQDDGTGRVQEVSSIVKITDEAGLGVGVYFPGASAGYYSNLECSGMAIKLRSGYDISYTSFGPSQEVQTYDGTSEITASFSPPDMIQPDSSEYSTTSEVLDTDNDDRDETVRATMEVPEYTDADNPAFGFEARRIGGSSDANQDYPTDWTETNMSGVLPQSDNQSSWPFQTSPLETGELTPGGPGYGNTTEYEIRGLIYEAGDRANTLTYTSDTWTFLMFNNSNST